VVCVAFGAVGLAAAAEDTGRALAVALAEQRALLREARAQGSAAASSASGLAAFEAALVAEGLLEPRATASLRLATATPPVSSPPGSGTRTSATASERGRARVARLATSRAPEEQVEQELEALARAEPPGAVARELVQDVLFRAVALTAVELRQQLEALRRSERFQAALRQQLGSLRAALDQASTGVREARDREVPRLEAELAAAGRHTRRASLDLDALLRDHEAVFARLARLSGRLYARARLALRGAGS
jgi:hypothetical protein